MIQLTCFADLELIYNRPQLSQNYSANGYWLQGAFSSPILLLSSLVTGDFFHILLTYYYYYCYFLETLDRCEGTTRWPWLLCLQAGRTSFLGELINVLQPGNLLECASTVQSLIIISLVSLRNRDRKRERARVIISDACNPAHKTQDSERCEETETKDRDKLDVVMKREKREKRKAKRRQVEMNRLALAMVNGQRGRKINKSRLRLN